MKQPFDIDVALERIAETVRPYPKAALFALADEGFATPFEQLVACMISIRTRDETTLIVARGFFAAARTPQQVAALAPDAIEDLIAAATFHHPKARQIHTIARRVVDEFGGELPCDSDTLQSFPGVGPKCANLVLGIACGQPQIGVDIHVHRVTNRWGYVHAATPEQTMVALEQVLPRHHRLSSRHVRRRGGVDG
jgi:endonuclease-3